MYTFLRKGDLVGNFFAFLLILVVSMVVFSVATFTAKAAITISVCHDEEELEVSPGESVEHVAHGDKLGSCDDDSDNDDEDDSDDEEEIVLVVVCHGGEETIEVVEGEELADHLLHGDELGECDEEDVDGDDEEDVVFVLVCHDGEALEVDPDLELAEHLLHGDEEGSCGSGDDDSDDDDDNDGGSGDDGDDGDGDGGDDGSGGDDNNDDNDGGSGDDGDNNDDNDSGDGSGGGNSESFSGGSSGGSRSGSRRDPSSGSSGGEVLGASVGVCTVEFTTFMKTGQQNNVYEVALLQSLLNEQGISVPVTGYYGPLTTNAVEQFQLMHKEEILKPWADLGLGLENAPTGYFYKTTQWKANQLLGCEKTFPLLP